MYMNFAQFVSERKLMPDDEKKQDWVPPEFANDHDIGREMRMADLSARLWLHRAAMLRKCVQNILTVAGVHNPVERSMTEEVSRIIVHAIHLVGSEELSPGVGETDINAAMEILLLALFRFSEAFAKDVKRKLDPASTEDPDEPMTI